MLVLGILFVANIFGIPNTGYYEGLATVFRIGGVVPLTIGIFLIGLFLKNKDKE